MYYQFDDGRVRTLLTCDDVKENRGDRKKKNIKTFLDREYRRVNKVYIYIYI